MGVRVPNLRLKAAREGLRWTQKEMADAVEKHAVSVLGLHDFVCSERKVQRWEAGVPPQKRAVRVLVSCLRMSAAELGLEPDRAQRFRSDGSSATVLEDVLDSSWLEDDVLRRQFVSAMPAVVAAPALVGSTQRLSMDHVDELRAAAERLWLIDNQVGGENLHPIAGQYLRRALPLLEGGGLETTRKAMHGAVGALAADAGWYAFDDADHPQARIYLNQGLLHARIAEDPVLEARILNDAANLALKEGRSREAVRAAQLGQRLVRDTGTPRMRALLTAREVGAWGQLRDKPAAEEAAARAWDHLSRADADDPDPLWVTFVGEAELCGASALGDSDLGVHNRAVAGLERAVAVAGSFPRNRVSLTAHLAHARLGAGDVEGACAAAEDAARSVASSSRTSNVLAAFTRKLSSHDARAARQFVQRWREEAPAPQLG